MTFDPEFKKALQLLPDSEKDKLILRLLKHDLNLASQLRFALLDSDSMLDKREEVKKTIIRRIERATEAYYSAGYLLMDVREISGEINEHVSIRKDKLGEIILNCLMLRQLLELNNERIGAETLDKAYTLCIYIVARVFKILMLIQKQHEDLHIEYREEIETIGKLIGKNHLLMKTAIHNGLDVNWLIQFEIPKTIDSIYRNLRKNGYLK
ncbi:MAG TPA: hypothetical protein DCL77_19535 [Prolixibacteraceae bacterium]|jgi:hypothetical protein|nr:hypothetical protein [Prolixibacteraceae bacterium]